MSKSMANGITLSRRGRRRPGARSNALAIDQRHLCATSRVDSADSERSADQNRSCQPPVSPGQGGRMSRRGWLLFATMGIIWGVPYLLIKIAVASVTPASLVFYRTALAAVLLLPLA